MIARFDTLGWPAPFNKKGARPHHFLPSTSVKLQSITQTAIQTSILHSSFLFQHYTKILPFICQLSATSFFISAQPRLLIGSSRLTHAEPDTAPTASTHTLSHLPLRPLSHAQLVFRSPLNCAWFLFGNCAFLNLNRVDILVTHYQHSHPAD